MVDSPLVSLGLWLKPGSNQELLNSYLSDHFRVEAVANIQQAQAHDLLLVDSSVYSHHAADLRQLRELVSPQVLPVLLMLPSDAEPPPDHTLWPVVDDWLFMPCAKRELQARLRVLLRTRHMSLAQEAQAVQRLQASEERYRQISSLVADAAYALRVGDQGQLHLVWLSEQAAQRLGGRLDARPGRAFEGWSDEADARATFEQQVALALAGNSSVQVFLARRPQAEPGWVRSFVKPWIGSDGGCLGVLGALQDIDKEQRLTQRLQQFRSAMDQSTAPVFVFDVAGHCTYANPAYNRLLPHTLPNALNLFGSVFEQVARGVGSEGVFSLPGSGAEKHQFSVQMSPVTNTHGTVEAVVAVATDLTERLYYEQQLQQLATRDQLTGLPNRTLLMEFVQDQLTRHGDCALVLACFVNLSQVNEAHGYEFGNVVFKALSERLQRLVPKSAWVSRVSGNELAVVLAGASPDTSLTSELAAWLKALTQPVDGPGNHIVPEMNLGIAHAPQDANGASELFQLAQSALNSCRKKGPNRFLFFDPSFNEAVKRRLALEAELQSALAHQEFELYFQPQVPLDPHGGWGCEALLRWRHPVRGLVMPGEFIGALEDTGLIHEVGAWVWSEAQRALQVLQTQGIAQVRLAVNVSPRQFERPAALHQAMSQLDEGLVRGHRLALELTESCLLSNTQEVTGMIWQLHQAGLHLSIDDFGTGYSSMMLLTELPLSELKIDQSFTRKLLSDTKTASLVSSLVHMAKHLGMQLVAEGVEEEAQARMLRDMGCDWLQGYLFSRPVPLCDLPRTLSQLGYPMKESDA